MSLEINQNLPQYSPEEEKEILSARIELWNQGILHWKLDVTQKKIYDFFFDNLSKVIVVNASRRLGKTYALAVIAIEMCIKNAKTYVDFIQPEVTMITNNVNPEVFEVLFEDCPLEIMPKFNPQKNYWLFPNGSRIKLAGTDNKNYNKLRGGSCMSGDTLIQTPEGPVAIKDIEVGDEVYGYENGEVVISRVKEKYDNGLKKVTKLFHKNQYIGAFTDEHKFLINSWSSVSLNKPIDREKQFKDLNKKNELIVQRLVKIPCGEVKEKFAYVIGAMIGDGCRRKYGNKLIIASQDHYIPEKIASYFENCIYTNHGNYRWSIGDQKIAEKHSTKIDFPYFKEWISGKNFLEKNFDYNVVDTWDRESCLMLLAGLTDTDGNVSFNKKDNSLEWSYSSSNLPLIKNIQKLIYKLIHFNPSIKMYNRKNGKNTEYILRIRSGFYVKELLKEMSPYLALERKKYQPYMEKLNHKDDGKSWTFTKGDSYYTNVYDIQVENKSHLYLLASGGLVTHNCNLAIIDEAGFCSDLNKIIKSIVIPKTLLTKGRVILASTTPDTPDHEFVDILQDAELKGSFIRKTIKDAIEEQKGTHLVRMTDEILQDILKSYVGGESNQEFQTEFMCVLPIDSNNSVISEFTHVEKDAVCLWPRPAYYDRYVGMDIGFDDLTFVIFGFWDFLNAVFYVEQEFIINGPALTSKVLAEEIDRIERELWTDPLTREKLPVYKRVSDNNKILINDLSKSPQKLYFIPTEKHEKDSFLNQMKVMMGGRQIKIHPRCKTLINHLKYATWNKTRTDFKRVTVDGQGHHHYDGVAALMYLVRNIDKNRNPYPKNYQHQSIIGNSDHYFIRPKDTDGESNNPSLNKLNKVLFKRNLSSFKK